MSPKTCYMHPPIQVNSRSDTHSPVGRGTWRLPWLAGRLWCTLGWDEQNHRHNDGMKERMNVCMNEWMKEWINNYEGTKNKQITTCLCQYKYMYVFLFSCVSECMYVRIYACMICSNYMWMEKQTNERMKEGRNEWTDETKLAS